MSEKNGVFQKFLYLLMAVGVCIPMYLVLHSISYVIEILWLPPERHVSGNLVVLFGVFLTLRVAWMFARAAVDGGPVLRVRPDPVVVAPTLGIGAPFGPDTEQQAEPAAERPVADGRLVPDTQHG